MGGIGTDHIKLDPEKLINCLKNTDYALAGSSLDCTVENFYILALLINSALILIPSILSVSKVFFFIYLVNFNYLVSHVLLLSTLPSS